MHTTSTADRSGALRCPADRSTRHIGTGSTAILFVAKKNCVKLTVTRNLTVMNLAAVDLANVGIMYLFNKDIIAVDLGTVNRAIMG